MTVKASAWAAEQELSLAQSQILSILADWSSDESAPPTIPAVIERSGQSRVKAQKIIVGLQARGLVGSDLRTAVR